MSLVPRIPSRIPSALSVHFDSHALAALLLRLLHASLVQRAISYRYYYYFAFGRRSAVGMLHAQRGGS
jgi:hypothetical protein